MLTVGDLEYEPPVAKLGELTKSCMVLVAGSFPVHAEAIGKTTAELSASPTKNVEAIAECYAGFVRAFRMREASQAYLAPLGLNEQTFRAAQRDMAPSAISELISQLQNHHTGPEAIIAGHDGGSPSIFHVDGRGFVTCHNDPGFVTIGIGSSHALSEITNAGYANWWAFGRTLLTFYAAKKRAEVAPGVGEETDISLVLRDGRQPLASEIFEKVDEIYRTKVARQKVGEDADEKALLGFFNELKNKLSVVPTQAPARSASSSKSQT
jgi:hypothetical protein